MPTQIEQPRNRFRAPRVIFWVAFGLRLLCILIGHTYKVKPYMSNFYFGFEAGRIARSLVEGHGYSSPFNGPSGPTAWLPPLYPLLLALSFKLFGVYSRGAALFVLSWNSFFSAAIAPAVFEIAARCLDAQGIARRKARQAYPVAMWSAWIWVAYPAALQYAIHWIWEMSLSTCLFTWALVLALRLRRIGEHEDAPLPAKRAMSLWAMMGLLWGLVALANASLLLVLPASILWILWPYLRLTELRAKLMQNIAGASLTCVVFAAVLSPWVIRNERTMHAFIPTRSNFGVELWQSAHFYWGAFPWGTALPLWPGDPEFREYVRLGEVEYAREKGIEAKQRLRAHPDRFLRNTAWRIDFFWSGVPHAQEPHPAYERVRILNYSFLSVAGILGLLLALKRRVPGAWLFAAAFGIMPVVYYAVTVQARFRHPIEPLIAILSVYLFRSTTPRAAKTGGASLQTWFSFQKS